MTLFDALALPISSTRGPRARWKEAREAVPDPLLAAIHAGRGSHTVGEVFFAGYQAAVENVTGVQATQALLVTERGRRAPREVETTFIDGAVSGTKAFALDGVEWAWVLASRGQTSAGRHDLVLAQVALEHAVREPLSLGWMPDVPHSQATFAEAPASRIVEDAWARVVRPFRTVEDLGVLGATAAARFQASTAPEQQERWLSVLVTAVALWGEDAESVGTIRALAGLQASFDALLDAVPDGPLGEHWTRDSTLFGVASAARAARLHRARANALDRRFGTR